MYTPDGAIVPIPGTAYGVMPVRLYSNDNMSDHRTQPAGYVLTMDTDRYFIELPGLYLTQFRALKEAVTLTEIEMRRNDPESV